VGKVFISYSHDTLEHSEPVVVLSNQLRVDHPVGNARFRVNDARCSLLDPSGLRRLQNPRRAELVAARLPWLGELVKWKTLFGAVGIALLMLYFALYANAVHHFVLVSDWAAGWLYGDAAERLRPF
jgi:hypothetical protein